jgi:anti-anti-sigma factor
VAGGRLTTRQGKVDAHYLRTAGSRARDRCLPHRRTTRSRAGDRRTAGELDLATVARLKDELSELRSAGFAQLVLDLRAVTFLDSSALSCCSASITRPRRTGRASGSSRAATAVRRVLDLTGTTELFDYVKVA